MTTLPTPLTVTDPAGGQARHAVGAHIVLLDTAGRVLLGRRSPTLPLAGGKWSTPCGNTEAGENVVNAAVRECWEELGVVVDPAQLRFGTVTHFVNDEGYGPAIAFFFVATRWTGTPSVQEPDKCSGLEWFSFDELPEPIVPYVANALADIRAGHTTGSLGFGFSTLGFDGPSGRLNGADSPVLPRGVYLTRQPRVLQSAAVLFTDEAGRVLLVHPTYRHDGLWTWPGGFSNWDERPRDTARREVTEELGLDAEPGALLTVNSNSATDRPPVTNWLYDGGTLTAEQITAIVLQDSELDDAQFFDPADAASRLSASAQGELVAALDARRCGSGAADLVDGQPGVGSAATTVPSPTREAED